MLPPFDPSRLPEIVEIKTKLDGRTKRFPCRLVARGDDGLVVLFVSSAACVVGGVELAPGTVTFGYFWPDRPYNAYLWLTAGGEEIGCYFNVADRTVIDGDTLAWRDLALDVFVDRSGRPRVLDADEIPRNLAAATRLAIDQTRRHLVARGPQLADQLRARSLVLWERLAGTRA